MMGQGMMCPMMGQHMGGQPMMGMGMGMGPGWGGPGGRMGGMMGMGGLGGGGAVLHAALEGGVGVVRAAVAAAKLSEEQSDRGCGKGGVLRGSADVSAFLLDEARIATVAGVDFGSDAHIRLSYATGLETIKEGLRRMAAAVRTLEGS